jgi:cytochrome c biogenesis protein CcdA
MKKLFSVFLLLFFCLPVSLPAQTVSKPRLFVFYSPGCHSCIRIKKEVLPELEREYQGKVVFEYKDIDDIENYKLLAGLQDKYKPEVKQVFPMFVLGGKFVNGEGNVKEKLAALLKGAPAAASDEAVPQVDLVKRFQGFSTFAIILVGLIDGINPCAVTAIVFFMSFLGFQGYRKREIVVIGLLFILSVYVTYVLIGLGIFESLYRLRQFWLLTKVINICVGTISIVFSGYALYDFMQYRKTKSTDDQLLSLPKSVKNQIHKVIGTQYRVNKSEASRRKDLFALAIGALITGFLVSVLEAVCVAKIYLPTIIFVLKSTTLKAKALTYLLLYNLLFVVPLLIIFFFALAGTSSERFQRVLKGHLGTIKILMGLMFLGLGLFLILRA